MNSKINRVLSFALVGMLWAISLSLSAASSDPADQSGAMARKGDSVTVAKVISKKEQAAAAAYWTRERIADAPAMAAQVDFGDGMVDTEALLQDMVGSEEPAGFSPAGMNAPGADDIARAYFMDDWLTLDDAIQAGDEGLSEEGSLYVPADSMAGTAGIYTSYDVNTKAALWKIYPHIWSGKLTFATPSGTSSCSATAISGNNIVTAAHCVYDTPSRNRFYSNWAFTPGFRNGTAPYGTFTANTCWVLTAWVNLSGAYSINTWARHDVAVCKMNKNAAGQTLNQAVGWAGRLWNAGSSQLVFNNGYPARTYTDALIGNGPAQYLRSCTAETFLQTTETLGGGCNWGRGISGGSWLVGYKPIEVSGQVNSVNSGLFIGAQNLYGARFNSNNIVPLCTAAGC
ncbi:exported hypothetical protein [Thiocapsa sp. KS1]|jgi:hypothetical protein|nr:trypsin-like serine protease [Thiocapsa sp. KS1]CRI65336.1 exported hypothetical protein [Thiocapsa sp. KS1]